MNLNWTRQQELHPYTGQERQGFTLTYIPHLQSLLLYGGSLNKASQVYLYNLAKKAWNVQKTSFHKEIARKYHTAYYQQSIRALIVYGGQADKATSIQTFDLLFVDHWIWKKLLIRNSLPPRQHHAFIPLSNGTFLIFGGITIPQGIFHNDLWVLKGINQLKLKDTSAGQLKGCSCDEIVTKGLRPSGRHSHKGYFYGECVYIVGGQAQNPQEVFTIYSLNIKILSWSKHNFNVTLPQLKRFSLIPNPHPESKGQVLIFGGQIVNSRKNNRFIYSLNVSSAKNPRLRQIAKAEPHIPYDLLDNISKLPFDQVCGIGCTFTKQMQLQLYRVQLSPFQQKINMQDYLRYIKNQQILSQQLIRKSETLELLYRQMQSYISTLHKQYKQSQGQIQDIEIQKEKQIQSCLKFKNQYMNIEKIYQHNLYLLKSARQQLTDLNEHFYGCMETERDEDP